ncbi:protein asteroid homolog 1-like isoform X1 [Halichondria panicea]|uniref:protein asteroid homolog 1-like isoform X1 n=1 Tax=Halichondria panicea TaxID=6063 RepID=UPI00312B7ACC
MGIPKLTSYIKKTDLIVQTNIRNMSSIVIDGYALCYKLHLGVESGDYCQFYEKVTTFLSGLNREIEVYVVIDGVDYENRKMETDRRRDVQRLQKLWRVDSRVEELSPYEIVISFMAKTVFMDAVCDSSVKYFVADGEADRDVVSLANHLRCPVFGSDSDYFIFNIEGGYIPIDDGRGGVTNLHGVVPCFNYHSFDSAYNLSSDARLLIPYCVGNDFHGSNALPELQIEQDSSVGNVVSKLAGRVNFDDFQNRVAEDYKFYRVDPHSFEELSQSRFLSGFNPLVPEWVVMQFKVGQFSHISMRFLASKDTKTWKYTIAIEDVTKESASEVTNTVFPYIAGALLSLEKCQTPPVRVYRKPKSFEFEANEVALSDRHRNILGSFNLLNIRDCPSEVREMILLQVFHCKSVCKTLRKIPDELKLAVVASRCWLKSVIHSIDHQFKAFILALVFCFHTCYSRSEFQIPLILNQMGRPRRIHHLAQWERMMHLVIDFNQILGSPFPYTSLGHLFSTTVFLNFFTSQPDFLYSKLDEEGRDMYDAITKKLLPGAPVEPVRQAQVVRAPRPQAIVTQNRFAQLS